MWGSDYPHLEGTWPNTSEYLRETFSDYPEDEIRAILGTNALGAYGFDPKVVEPIADKIGPSLSSINGDA
jgi:predicted TIM-barrel fold metal-dependent hydrolase